MRQLEKRDLGTLGVLQKHHAMAFPGFDLLRICQEPVRNLDYGI